MKELKAFAPSFSGIYQCTFLELVSGLPWVKSQTGPYTEGKQMDERGRPSRLAGGRFNKEGTLHKRLYVTPSLVVMGYILQ